MFWFDCWYDCGKLLNTSPGMPFTLSATVWSALDESRSNQCEQCAQINLISSRPVPEYGSWSNGWYFPWECEWCLANVLDQNGRSFHALEWRHLLQLRAPVINLCKFVVLYFTANTFSVVTSYGCFRHLATNTKLIPSILSLVLVSLVVNLLHWSSLYYLQQIKDPINNRRYAHRCVLSIVWAIRRNVVIEM